MGLMNKLFFCFKPKNVDEEQVAPIMSAEADKGDGCELCEENRQIRFMFRYMPSNSYARCVAENAARKGLRDAR